MWDIIIHRAVIIGEYETIIVVIVMEKKGYWISQAFESVIKSAKKKHYEIDT